MEEPTKPGDVAACVCPACLGDVFGRAPDFDEWGHIRCNPCRRTGILRWSVRRNFKNEPAGTPFRELIVDGFYPKKERT